MDFRPFSAWRYDPQKVSLEDVIAPPYDVISQKQQETLYQKSPYNCIRLILNKKEAGDTDRNNRYSRACDTFQKWQREVLLHEDKPCFYLYQQIFRDPLGKGEWTRSALIGRLKCESPDRGIVVPHEKTLPTPREDRRRLLETTKTNFSCVFGLYEDPQHEVAAITSAVSGQAPAGEAEDLQGVRHRFWIVKDPVSLEKIKQALTEKKVYIADGHHRYQTALEHAYRQAQRPMSVALTGDRPSDFVMMALVEFHDPGLLLLPTHRLFAPPKTFDIQKGLKTLERYFDVKRSSEEQVMRAFDYQGNTAFTPGAEVKFGLVLNSHGSYEVSLKDARGAREKMPAGKSEAWYGLEVNVLNHLILNALWGIPEPAWESALQFTHSTAEAAAAVETKKAQAAFLLKAPAVELLREMGKSHEVMVQKSTYFYPKLASGLVFYNQEA